MSEEEKELVNNCKLWVTEEDINYTRWFGLNELGILVNLIEKQKEEIECWRTDALARLEMLSDIKKGIEIEF